MLIKSILVRTINVARCRFIHLDKRQYPTSMLPVIYPITRDPIRIHRKVIFTFPLLFLSYTIFNPFLNFYLSFFYLFFILIKLRAKYLRVVYISNINTLWFLLLLLKWVINIVCCVLYVFIIYIYGRKNIF